jgi:hypothetical protein
MLARQVLRVGEKRFLQMPLHILALVQDADHIQAVGVHQEIDGMRAAQMFLKVWPDFLKVGFGQR